MQRQDAEDRKWPGIEETRIGGELQEVGEWGSGSYLDPRKLDIPGDISVTQAVMMMIYKLRRTQKELWYILRIVSKDICF